MDGPITEIIVNATTYKCKQINNNLYRVDFHNSVTGHNTGYMLCLPIGWDLKSYLVSQT